MAVLTSGNPAVDLMGSIRITGNITDLEWYKHIRKPSGKPNHLAVSILSDIVYWYRPTDVRDENTGFVIAKKKKFKGDLLQKTYKAYADMYGESRDCVKKAFDQLENMGLIKRYFRDIVHPDGTESNNVMFIELFPTELCKISNIELPEKGEVPLKITPPPLKNEGRLTEKYHEEALKTVGGHSDPGDTLPLKKDPPPLGDDNNTYNIQKTIQENNTEIINRDYHSFFRSGTDPSLSEGENERKADVYDHDNSYRLIFGNIGYDDLVLKHPANRKVIDRILKILVDTVCSKEPSMFVAKKNRPIGEIRDRYISLTREHIEHVLKNLPEDDSGVVLKDKFLMAYLFNATETIDQICSTKNLHNKPGPGFMDIIQREYDYAALEREALEY